MCGFAFSAFGADALYDMPYAHAPIQVATTLLFYYSTILLCDYTSVVAGAHTPSTRPVHARTQSTIFISALVHTRFAPCSHYPRPVHTRFTPCPHPVHTLSTRAPRARCLSNAPVHTLSSPFASGSHLFLTRSAPCSRPLYACIQSTVFVICAGSSMACAVAAVCLASYVTVSLCMYIYMFYACSIFYLGIFAGMYRYIYACVYLCINVSFHLCIVLYSGGRLPRLLRLVIYALKYLTT